MAMIWLAVVLGVAFLFYVVYRLNRINKLIDYVLGKDDPLINLSAADTSYTELPEYIFVLSVFSKPINDRLILGVYGSSDRARERLNYYKKSFRHPENYINYQIDSIPNNLKEDK